MEIVLERDVVLEGLRKIAGESGEFATTPVSELVLKIVVQERARRGDPLECFAQWFNRSFRPWASAEIEGLVANVSGILDGFHSGRLSEHDAAQRVEALVAA